MAISCLIFFADDVLLFAKAKRDQAMMMKKTLENFCNKLGIRVSLIKYQIESYLGFCIFKAETLEMILWTLLRG
uniref:Reverse transcriptase domain-containing protein n=1 Tax=Cajanus cajan TaxID=3821 RepID=A0A151QWT5_CAJCA|nr:hypothetical protein KK1_044180 [Cajanus cajan]